MSRHYHRTFSQKSSSGKKQPRFTAPPIIQPKTAKESTAELPEWKPGGSGITSPLERLRDAAAVQAQLTVGQPNDKYEREASGGGILGRSPQVQDIKIQSFGSGSSNRSICQRLVIGAARIGLPANIDTTNYDTALQQVKQLRDENKLAELSHIKQQLTKHGTTSGWFESATNDEKLLKIVNKLLSDGPMDIPEMNAMGYFDKKTAKKAVEDRQDVDETLRDQINIWVIGDKQRGIVWGAIGNHLRGSIDLKGYRELGDQCYLLLTPLQQQAIDNTPEPDQTLLLVNLAQQAFDDAIHELRQGLGALPDFDGKSYRQAGLLDNTVFNGKIGKNDYIMDKAFWSTSLFRGAGGAAGTWTDIGSTENPIVYFIIEGETGKYIAKYAKTEGEQEVLFRDRTVFQVTRIVNMRNATFFVYVTEVDATTLINPTIKNPFTGATY